MVISLKLILNTCIITNIKPIIQLVPTIIFIIIPYYLLSIAACFFLVSSIAFYPLVAY